MKKNTKKHLIATLCVMIFLLGAFESFGQRRGRSVHVVQVKKRGTTKVVRINRSARLGTRVSVLPNGTVIRTYNRIHYRYHNGIYYKPAGKQYIIVAPPVGITVSMIPTNSHRVESGKKVYYYHDGIFYRKAGPRKFVVSQPSVKTVVQEIPDDTKIVVVNGKAYYKYNNTYYRQIHQKGSVSYRVVEVS